MVRIRGALISAIFYKSLRLVAADAEDAAAITLVTADVPGIQDLISLVYDSISMVIEFGFGIAILSLLVGAASIFTVLTAISKPCFRIATDDTRRLTNECSHDSCLQPDNETDRSHSKSME